MVLNYCDPIGFRFSASIGNCTVKKKIICNETGTLFDSINEASREMKLFKSNIVSHLKGRVRHCGGYTFRYFDKEPL